MILLEFALVFLLGFAVGFNVYVGRAERAERLVVAYRKYANDLARVLVYYRREYGWLDDADAPIPKLRIEL